MFAIDIVTVGETVDHEPVHPRKLKPTSSRRQTISGGPDVFADASSLHSAAPPIFAQLPKCARSIPPQFCTSAARIVACAPWWVRPEWMLYLTNR